MRVFGSRRPSPPAAAPVTPPVGSIAWYDNKQDPLAYLVQANYREWHDTHRPLPLGVYRDEGSGHLFFRWTHPRYNTLVTGPPGSNKSVGVAATQLLTHFGPAVVMSSKTDLARLTAVARSRFGPVAHLDVSGERPIPGLIPVWWSLVDAAEDWAQALEVAADLTKAAASKGDEGFWTNAASSYIAVALHTAALGGRDMDFVMRVIRGSEGALDDVEDILAGSSQGADPLDVWTGLLRTHAAGLSSIQLTASTAMRLYNRPAVRRQNDRVGLDLVSFIEGDPYGITFTQGRGDPTDDALEAAGIYPRPILGTYGTVFVTCDDPGEAQVIYRALMRTLWKLVPRQHDTDIRANFGSRRRVLLLVDELANLAPDPSYPEMASQCADQGLIITSLIQDIRQLERNFGTDAQTFLTTHRERLFFPGIINDDLLKLLSSLTEPRWETRTTNNASTTVGKDTSRSSSTNENEHRYPMLEPSDIYNGRRGDPKAVLYYPPEPGFGYLWPAPVYQAPPFPRALIASLEIQANASMDGPFGTSWPVANMPVPDLGRKDDRDGVAYLIKTQHGGADLHRRYSAMVSHYANSRNEATSL